MWIKKNVFKDHASSIMWIFKNIYFSRIFYKILSMEENVNFSWNIGVQKQGLFKYPYHLYFFSIDQKPGKILFTIYIKTPFQRSFKTLLRSSIKMPFSFHPIVYEDHIPIIVYKDRSSIITSFQ